MGMMTVNEDLKDSRTIHLGKNPKKGGIPPRDRIKIRRLRL
jgi:hypothetical protein